MAESLALTLTPARTAALINALKTRHAVLRGLLSATAHISSNAIQEKRAEAVVLEDMLRELEPVRMSR